MLVRMQVVLKVISFMPLFEIEKFGRRDLRLAKILDSAACIYILCHDFPDILALTSTYFTVSEKEMLIVHYASSQS